MSLQFEHIFTQWIYQGNLNWAGVNFLNFLGWEGPLTPYFFGACIVANQKYSHWHAPSHPLACANIIGANIVRERADVVSTKVDIILSFSFFFFSYHVLFAWLWKAESMRYG